MPTFPIDITTLNRACRSKSTDRVCRAGGDTASNTATATITVDLSLAALAVTPDDGNIYVGNTNAANVSVIVTASNTVIATIPVGTSPQGAAVTPDGSRVYVTNSESNSASVIATAMNTVTATIPVSNSPIAFGVFIAAPMLSLSTETATSDFDGDGHSDILWQNTSGEVVIWEMKGTSVIGGDFA